MPSIKGNIILSGINTVTGIIFPVITFPYVARVLLPEGIGAVNFLNSIISYIVLLTSLGIPMYAVKEIAKYRDNKEIRNRITVEILILSTFLCLFGYIAVWALAKFVPQIHEQSALFYILSLTILLTGMGVNWFYQGIEDFKFITVRGIMIRISAAIALFIFVKDSSDLLIYGLVFVGSTVGNSLLNFIHLRKYIDFKSIKWNELRVLPHIKPSIQVFIFNLITSLYLQINSIMLGFMAGDVEVGYFSAGTKISHVGLLIITSLGTVLLPHCAHLLKAGRIAEFKSVINKSLNVTLALSLPMTVGLIILASSVTFIFCGSEYMDSISVLRLNAPVIIFISLTNIMGLQILFPMDKIKIVIWSVTGGALSNLILNLILIPKFGATGAAASSLIAELTVLMIQLVAGRSYFPFKTSSLINWKYLIGSSIMGLMVIISIYTIKSYAIQLAVGVSVGITVYLLYLFICKDALALELKRAFTNRLLKKSIK